MRYRLSRLPHEDMGQMSVELAILIPVVVVVALIGWNLMRYVQYCARFDQLAADAVISQGVSPGGVATQVDAARAVRQTIQDAMGSGVEIQVEASAVGRDGKEATHFTLAPHLVRFSCTMRMAPWPSRIQIAQVGYQAPAVLAHSVELVVDTHKSGVVV